jgi:exoribonuclease R
MVSDKDKEISRIVAYYRHRHGHVDENIKTTSTGNASYCLFDETRPIVHAGLQVEHYSHMTSPIRRMADFVNQALFLRECMGISFTQEWNDWLHTWLQEESIDDINAKMRNTRKYQLECELMQRCFHDTSIFQQEYSGWVFDVVTNANTNENEYMVYIADLQLFSRVREETAPSIIEMNRTYSFRIYLFEDESTVYRKIRVQRVL